MKAVRILFIITCILLWDVVNAQTYTVDYNSTSQPSFNQPTQINACGDSVEFRIEITASVNTTELYVVVELDEGIEMVDWEPRTTQATLSLFDPNPTRPIFLWSGVPANQEQELSLTLSAFCSSIEPDGTKDAVDTAYVSTSPSRSNNFTTAPYSIKSPVIQYNAAKSSNMSTQAIV